jgi:hypothetical protein
VGLKEKKSKEKSQKYSGRRRLAEGGKSQKSKGKIRSFISI